MMAELIKEVSFTGTGVGVTGWLSFWGVTQPLSARLANNAITTTEKTIEDPPDDIR
jgi:hypothetical protein